MKDFLFKHKGLWRTLLCVFTFVFVFAFTLGNVLEQYSGQVNKQLGTVTSKVVSDDDTDLYDIYTPKFGTSDELLDEHVKVGAQVGAEGSVLLQNENGALPLNKDKEKITLFGSASTLANGFFGMQYGATVTAAQNVSLYDALTDRGASVNPDMNSYNEAQAATIPGTSNSFTPGFTGTTTENGYEPFEFEPDTSLVGDYDDVGIVVIGRGSAESADYFPGSLGINSSYGARSVLALTDAEKSVVKAAKDSCDKVVVLINSCNPMELGPIMSGGECEADAILWIGFPGNYGYYGVADVLLGNENPSGRLVDTYAYDTTSSPAMQNFGIYRFGNIENNYIANGGTIEENDRADYYLVEPESIYTGYKYYETRYEDAVLGQGNASSSAGAFDSAGNWSYGEEVAYSFGEGLSYTTFSQKIVSVEWPDEEPEPGDDVTATMKVEVENTGDVAGRSVVQVYGQSPYTDYDRQYGVEKASVQLLNFAKTDVIEPKDSATISIDVDMQLLASYDTEGAGTYIMEAGDYYFALGCNEAQEGAHAAVNNILAAKGYGLSDGMDSEGDEDAAWKFSWDENYEDLFSISKEGAEVENELEDADLNYWIENTVTYLSRSDWEWKDEGGKSMWNSSAWSDSNRKGYTWINATGDMIFRLGNDTYEIDLSGEGVEDVPFDQENGVTFADMIDENGNVLPYDSDKWDLLLDELNLSEAIEFVALGERTYSELTSIGFLGGYLAENGPTGVGLTISSYTSEAYWHDPKDPNASYRWDDVGCALLQAATFDKALLEEIGEMWGNDALYTGLAVIWGPSINSHRTPYNGRIAEYYSEDSVLSGYCASNVGFGASKFGLIVTAKHFAFNDQESNRNGVAPFFDEQKARENDLRAFQIAIEGGVKAVMTAFNRVGCTYSSAHTGLISGILRGEWDFCGYAISDMVNPAQYMTFKESVIAGTSTFDNSEISEYWGATSADGLVAMYSGDAKMLQAIKDAVHADLWTFANSNMANYVSGETMWVSNWWRDLYIILECSAGVIAASSLVLYIGCKVWDKNKKKEEK